MDKRMSDDPGIFMNVCGAHGHHGPICPDCVQGERARGSGEASPVADVGEQYHSLERTLNRALKQASIGKGRERHAAGEPFEDQKICQLARYQGSIDGPVFQACKKALEAKRLGKEAAVAELLGAINYLAAAVIVREEQP